MQRQTQERGHFIRTLTGREIWILDIDEDIAKSSSGSSARSSPSLAASILENSNLTPLYLSVPISDNSTQARKSLQAIMSSISTSDKWLTLSPSLALEILRITNTAMSRLPEIESHLQFNISKPSSRLYQEAEQRVLQALFPVLQNLVATYTPLSSVQIFETAIASKSSQGGAPHPAPRLQELKDIATRIAHMGILHWRVWAPLAYLVDPDAEEGTVA
jgi:T-complex protein 11